MNNSVAPVPVTMEPVDPVYWYGCWLYYRFYLSMGGSRKIRGVQNLETVRPHQLLEQIVCTAFRAAADTLNQTRFGGLKNMTIKIDQLYFTIASALKLLQANKLPGDMEIIQDVKRLCVVFEHVEKLLTLGSGSGNQWSHQQREIGIWSCKDCGKVKAGGPYTLKFDANLRPETKVLIDQCQVQPSDEI
ncbi:hypothetical protein Lser_V15G39499 [Lactuca serriola]